MFFHSIIYNYNLPACCVVCGCLRQPQTTQRHYVSFVENVGNVEAGARHPSLRSPYIEGFPPSPQSYTLSLQQVLSPPVCTSQHAQHAIILLILWPIQPSYTL